ncbi:Uu.00g021990.m01.CDS01 [Anthostomella pinea]|uniref:Uu.00g021990.m01.CDS01 n=1 Tax=Anthostomella pinea TaxID=933095 RepID=A0AAI8W0A8_9PEZI|nr:Uu.00g021990.m01.CDS01 [Anthostomella pinea]
MASQADQSLSDDVLWYTAKHFLRNPLDVLNLTKSSRSLYEYLKTEILIADIYHTKS